MMRVRRAQVRDIGSIASRVRDIDRVECAAGGVTPKQAMRFGMRFGEAYTVEHDVPLAMFGVVPGSLLTGSGTAWLIATDDALKHPRAWLTIGREWAAAVIAEYPHVRNRVHKDNRVAIRWLSRVGFDVAPEAADDQFRDFVACASPFQQRS